MNLSGDDDIGNQRERGGNQHGPLAWIVGIGDCDLIHGVGVTGGYRCSDDAAVETNHVKAEGKGQPLYRPCSSGGDPKAGVWGRPLEHLAPRHVYLAPSSKFASTSSRSPDP